MPALVAAVLAIVISRSLCLDTPTAVLSSEERVYAPLGHSDAFLATEVLYHCLSETDSDVNKREVFRELMPTVGGVNEALRGLQDDQTLHLTDGEIQLTDTIVIDASNVDVVGDAGETTVLCPSTGGAFLIRGSNVTLRGLTFSRCQGEPAVRVDAIGIADEKLRNGPEADASAVGFSANCKSGVTLNQCSFVGNSATLGAAVLVVNRCVTIEDAFFEGNAADYGGAIHTSNAELVVRGASFVANSAKVNGGGISMAQTSRLFLTNATFSANKADSGGSVAAGNSEATIESCSFMNNAAQSSGGAVSFSGGSRLLVENATFVANTAAYGGAVIAWSSGLTLRDSVFSDNSADVNGGAFSVQTSNLRMEDSAFVGNRAQYGGVLIAYGSEVKVDRSAFSDNSAGSNGGAIDVNSDTRLSVRDATFTNNTASYGGAVIAAQSRLTLSCSTFEDNAGDVSGGAVSARQSSRVSLEDSVFSGNIAGQGGAVVAAETEVIAKRCSYTNNSARTNGGAFNVRDGSLLVENATFTNNAAGHGGAVTSWSSDLTFRASTFRSNSAKADGGAISVQLQSRLTLAASVFFDNNADYGGGVIAAQSNVTIENSSFSNNGVGVNGGAVNVFDGCRLGVANSTFINNTAAFGGGLHALRSTVTLRRCPFEGNSAESLGGGAFLWLNNEEVSVDSCPFSDNEAYEGGAVSVTEARLAVWNSSFVENVARSKGGVFSLESFANVSVRSTKFVQNTGRNGGVVAASHSTLNIDGCLFDENSAPHGAVAFVLISSATIANSTLRRNLAWFGGCVHAQSSPSFLHDSVFVENFAKYGGVLFSLDSTTVARDLILEGNSAGYGGVMNINGISSLVLTDSRLSHNRANYGGGVFADESVLQIRNVTFTNHSASQAGGAICMVGSSSTLNVADSVFEKNEVGRTVEDNTPERDSPNERAPMSKPIINPNEKKFAVNGGGALAVDGARTVIVASCRFEDNCARRGGAFALYSDRPNSTQSVSDCLFSRNRAVAGGALYVTHGESPVETSDVTFVHNKAETGGAVCFENGASIQTSSGSAAQALHFENNLAHRGAGLFCDRCTVRFDHPVTFIGNAATDFGGGAALMQAAAGSTISTAEFERNAASRGGAVAARDCEHLALGSSSGGVVTNFTNNSAREGGAIHMEGQAADSVEYKIERCLFEANEATELSAAVLGDADPPAERWKEELEGALLRFDVNRSDGCGECAFGRGGALSVAVNRNDESNIQVSLTDVEITNNKASVGGGGYIKCSSRNQGLQGGCSFMRYQNVVVSNNIASITAGGIFVSALTDFSLYHVTSAPAVVGNGKGAELSGFVVLEDNKILEDGNGYGPDLATDASSLQLLNVHGRLDGLTAGTKLLAPGKDTRRLFSRMEPILVAVLDALGQRITAGSDDSSLGVILLSDWISGKRQYGADDGLISVSDTFVAGVNKTEQLIIQSQDERMISVSVTFSTLPCQSGELMIESETGCFRCPYGNYTFRPTEDSCRACEKHASCSGTTALVPDEGFWHSTPFSPVIRRCLVKEACSYEGRENILFSYYEDSQTVLQQVEALESRNGNGSNYLSDYQQCAPGYTGIVCGSCAAGYGHAESGDCVECVHNLTKARVLSISLISVIFAVVSVKLCLGVNGVKKEAACKLAEDKERAKSILRQASENPSSPKRLRRGSRRSRSKKRLQRRRSSIKTPPASDGEEASNEGASTSTVQRHSSLERSAAIEDPLLSPKQGERINLKTVKASGALFDNYNIAYNYVQLNAVALCLDVYWNGALRNFLSVQSLLGRVINVKVLPFDCSFSDRGHDVGIPNSLAALCFRACFPLATILVYILCIHLYKLIRPEARTPQCQVDALPRARLVALVVYLAYCIDIFSYLLKVLHCVHLEPVDPSHPHAEKEILEPKSVWTGDTAVTCWEGDHLWATVAASVGLFLSLGTIAFMPLILRKGKRENKLNDPGFLLKYGVLYVGYRQQGLALYWEVVLTARRALLAVVTEYARHGESSDLQVALVAMIIFAFVILHEVVVPYDNDDSEDTFPSYAGGSFRLVGAHGLADRWVAFNRYVSLNGLESTSLLVSLSLFWTATSIGGQGTNPSTEADILLFISFLLNAVFSAFMFYRLWYCLHHYLDVAAEAKSVFFKRSSSLEEDRKTWLLVKVWVILVSTSSPTDDSDDVENGDV